MGGLSIMASNIAGTDITNSSNPPLSILYLDDEEHNLAAFRATFRRDYQIYTATSGREALQILREHPVQLIVTDQRMPEMTGVQFLEAVIPEFPDAVRMILTGFSDVEAIIKAINTGRVFRYITKPWEEQDLRATIKGAFEYYTLQQKNRQLLLALQEKVNEQERIMNLFRKYVPESVVASALESESDQAIFDGESRIVSVLFSDIRNFTSLAADNDPKRIIAFLNDYFTLMNKCVVACKGNINKFIGDGLLAIFGAPISDIENQHNAVYCALSMKEALVRINDKYAAEFGRPIEIGIGIHTGEVIVGNIGSEERIEYTAIGETVNLSSRIEQMTKAQPNTILISESTHRVVRDDFRFKDWGEAQVKGLTETIRLYEVLGRKN